jgi:predicted branched-subunit amino acid permease
LASAATAIIAERFLGGAWHILLGAFAGIGAAALSYRGTRRAP